MDRIKQTELANILNISNSYLSMILNGSRNTTWNIARSISRITGVDPGQIMDATPGELCRILNVKRRGNGESHVFNISGASTREGGSSVTVEN